MDWLDLFAVQGSLKSRFSHVQLFSTLWTIAHQAPLSTRFSRQEYWSRLPFVPPGDLSNPGIESMSLASPALAARFFTLSHLGSPSSEGYRTGNTGDMGSIPGSGRSPGEGNGNLLQYSCLENLVDRGAWWAIVHRVEKSWT